jgi:histidine triad (HIT) family protein
MASDSQCVFCRIVARDLPAEILWEDDRVVSILDINPIHFGHALVFPRHHSRDLLALRDEDLHAVLKATQVVADALVRGLQLEGFNVFSNNGRVAGQSVFHFHMHITPRYPEDHIRFVPDLKTYGPGLMAEYGRKIRAHVPPKPQVKEI